MCLCCTQLLSPICTADKVRLIICCSLCSMCFSSVLSPSAFFFLSLSPSFSAQPVELPPLPSPPLHCCHSISLTLSGTVAPGCVYLTLPRLTFPLSVSPSPTIEHPPPPCGYNHAVALRVSLLMCGLLHTVYTCQTSTRRMFYTQLNSTLN